MSRGSISFDWDERKNRSNQKKHRVSFEEARSVFSDEEALLQEDEGHSAMEDRFVLLGLASTLRTLVVCHCYRDVDEVIRIISARKATRTEQAQYKRASRR